MNNTLSVRTEVDIHFYDVDSIRMVWHGNYVKYLENGREAFGQKYGMPYMEVYKKGYVTPIVDMHIQYKHMARFEDTLIVETRYVPCRSAKIIYEYTIYNKSDMTVVAEAQTTQLFMTTDGVFEVSTPDFYREWKEKVLHSATRYEIQDTNGTV